MEKLYYLVVEKGRIEEMLCCLRSHKLVDDVIAEHYRNHGTTNGEMVMWCSSDKYPCFVYRSQEDTIKKCGERIYY